MHTFKAFGRAAATAAMVLIGTLQPGQADSLHSRQDAAIAETKLNGFHLQGTNLNAMNFNAMNFNGTVLNGVWLNGAALGSNPHTANSADAAVPVKVSANRGQLVIELPAK